NAFKSQQHRWAKGSIQTCRKLLPTILRAKIPLAVKVEAFFHLTANFNYPLMCVLSVLMFPSMVIRYNMGWYEMLLIDVPLFFAATFSVCNFYMVCQREIHRDWRTRIKYLPFLMSIGIGLSINNTRAVFEALFDKQSEFTRTPKYRIEADGDEWVGKKYRQSVAVLRVSPDSILSDIDRLVDVGGVSDALARGKTTILKDNISWHFPFPAANTTPWQLEGTIQALARRGFADQVCVQNKTVVTNA